MCVMLYNSDIMTEFCLDSYGKQYSKQTFAGDVEVDVYDDSKICYEISILIKFCQRSKIESRSLLNI